MILFTNWWASNWTDFLLQPGLEVSGEEHSSLSTSCGQLSEDELARQEISGRERFFSHSPHSLHSKTGMWILYLIPNGKYLLFYLASYSLSWIFWWSQLEQRTMGLRHRRERRKTASVLCSPLTTRSCPPWPERRYRWTPSSSDLSPRLSTHWGVAYHCGRIC